MAVPRYPSAENLDTQSKLLMIMDYFDKDQDDTWNKSEFLTWQDTLKKPQKSTWDSTSKYYLKNFNIIINKGQGKEYQIVIDLSVEINRRKSIGQISIDN